MKPKLNYSLKENVTNYFGLTLPIWMQSRKSLLIFYFLDLAIFIFFYLSNSINIISIDNLKLFTLSLLWGLFILLIFVNGLSYFFNIDVITEMKNLFSQEPEINISSTINNNDISMNPNEVYHVPGNRFTYHDAKAVCKAFDGEMATYNQLNDAQKKGASWCSYGWTKDQLGVYPTSQSDWTKLQEKEGHEYDCGLPGINGGYVPNPHTKLGANCYGVKPKQSELEKEYISKDLFPKTTKELLFEQRVQYWKDRISNILISPFNSDNWFKVPS